MRLLQLTSVIDRDLGGAENTLREFREQLQARGHQVVPLGLSEPGATRAHKSGGTLVPIENIYWPFENGSHSASARLVWHMKDIHNRRAGNAFARELAAVNPELILAHNLSGWSLTPLTVARKANTPVVQVLHDYGLLCISTNLRHGVRECGSWNPLCTYRRAVARRASNPAAVVAVSQYVLDKYDSFGFYSTVEKYVVHPEIADQATLSTRARPKLSWPPRLGYLGRVVPDKGLIDLLRVARLLALDVVVAGDDGTHYAQSLKMEFPSGVAWQGHVPPAELFANIDILVVPSRWPEPFGRVAKEAGIAGVPMIVSDKGGIREAVETSTAPYVIVDTQDLQATADAVTRLVSGDVAVPHNKRQTARTDISQVIQAVGRTCNLV